LPTDDGGKLGQAFLESQSLTEVFECLFENAPDLIVILDKQGKVLAINHVLESLTGFRRKEILGKSFIEVLPRKILLDARKGFEMVMKGKSMRGEYKTRIAKRSSTLFEITAVPCKSGGKIVAVLLII
jgi:PAS domain S-box-containing protein